LEIARNASCPELRTMPKKPIERVNGKRETTKRRPQPPSRDWHTHDPTKVEGDQTLLDKDHLDELLQRKGDYVLIKGRRIIGIFADRQDAIEKAVALFGTEPALIKRIVAREPILTLGGAAGVRSGSRPAG
jgi:hypothetical protein